MDENRTEPLASPPTQYGTPVPPPRSAPWRDDEPFYRRHGLAFAISTGVLALILLLGMVAVGTFAVASVATRAAHTIAHIQQAGPRNGAVPGRPGAPARPGKDFGGMKNGLAVVRGTIDTRGPSSWTITTLNGTAVKVTITSATIFGARSSQGSASDFAAGDEIAVLGKRSGDTITAARIVKTTGQGKGRQAPSSPTPSPTAP